MSIAQTTTEFTPNLLSIADVPSPAPDVIQDAMCSFALKAGFFSLADLREHLSDIGMLHEPPLLNAAFGEAQPAIIDGLADDGYEYTWVTKPGSNPKQHALAELVTRTSVEDPDSPAEPVVLYEFMLDSKTRSVPSVIQQRKAPAAERTTPPETESTDLLLTEADVAVAKRVMNRLTREERLHGYEITELHELLAGDLDVDEFSRILTTLTDLRFLHTFRPGTTKSDSALRVNLPSRDILYLWRAHSPKCIDRLRTATAATIAELQAKRAQAKK